MTLFDGNGLCNGADGCRHFRFRQTLRRVSPMGVPDHPCPSFSLHTVTQAIPVKKSHETLFQKDAPCCFRDQ